MANSRALIAVTDFGVEEPELLEPVSALTEAGVELSVLSTSGKTVQTVTGDKDWASTYEPDGSLEGVSADGYDILVLPGGTVNADTLRINADSQRLINEFADAGKPIAAICHAPWALIDAGVAKGKTLTSYESVKIDLENAGVNWVDQEVKRCPANGWVLITSRNPGDLKAFNTAVIDELNG